MIQKKKVRTTSLGLGSTSGSGRVVVHGIQDYMQYEGQYDCHTRALL